MLSTHFNWLCPIKVLRRYTEYMYLDKCLFCRSEGFPNGIFDPCALWDGGLARWKNWRAVVGVIWKMTKYKEMYTFSKMGMSEISRNVYLSEIKAPAGCQDRKLPLQELTPDELIHFPDNLKKWLFPIFVLLVTIYGIRSLFYRKPKWSVWSIWTYSTGWILKIVI